MLPFIVIRLAVAVSSKIIEVTVGEGGIVYKPNNFTAAKGDVVAFQFIAGAHSVSQSGGVDAPCVQLVNGFDSNFVPAARGWNLTIEDDTGPIWFYCKQGTHCQNGMAGVINAASPDLLDTYIANAAKLSADLQQVPALSLRGIGASSKQAPGPLPRAGDATNPTVIGTSTALLSSGTVSPSASPSTNLPSASPSTNLRSNRSSSTTSTWLTRSTSTAPISPTSASGSATKTRVIVAIVAPTAALALAASAVIFLRRRRRRLHRDGVAPYAVSASATPAPAASKLDPVPHIVDESEAGPTTMSELRELATEMQRAGISVRAMLSSLRAPRDDAVSDGSLPGYAP